MKELIERRTLEQFISDVSDVFPRCVGGVLADRHGFVLSSNMRTPEFDENDLALQAITERRIINTKQYIPIVKDLDKDNRIMLLVEEDSRNLAAYKKLYQVLRERNPF